MAGLLAARVLSRWFSEVVVFDRDELPLDAVHRKGTPQSRHAHGFLARGQQVINELVPGFRDELVARGGLLHDQHKDVLWYNDGLLLKQAPSDLVGLLASRPLIESVLRKLVSEHPGIVLRDGTAVTGLTMSGGRLSGVQTEGGHEPAELVVDATGRSNRGPTWLAELGYEAPREDTVRAGIVYSTREYRRDPDAQDFIGIISGHYPGNPVGAGSGANEDNKWLVTLVGPQNDPPPAEPGAFEDYAARLDGPELHRLIRTATPLTEPTRFRISPSVRRRYENSKGLPEGFIATGDSLCCFNPAYGQGMTTAALTAQWLDTCLQDGTDNLTSRYFRGAAKIIGPAWELSTSADLRFPEVEGPRPLPTKILNRYIGRLHRAAEHDPVIGRQFLMVANLLAPPQSLLSPKILWRVIRQLF